MCVRAYVCVCVCVCVHVYDNFETDIKICISRSKTEFSSTKLINGNNSSKLVMASKFWPFYFFPVHARPPSYSSCDRIKMAERYCC